MQIRFCMGKSAFFWLLKQIQGTLLLRWSFHPMPTPWNLPWLRDSLRLARVAIADAMNQVARQSHRSSYHEGRAATTIYQVPGCIFDDAHANLHVPFSFAIELRGHHHFQQPAILALQCGKELTAGFLAFLPMLNTSSHFGVWALARSPKVLDSLEVLVQKECAAGGMLTISAFIFGRLLHISKTWEVATDFPGRCGYGGVGNELFDL